MQTQKIHTTNQMHPNMIPSVYLTSNPGYDPAALLWADLQRWLVHTEDPTSRPRPPQTTQTHTHADES